MNKKGEVGKIGLFITVFIMVIVALILLQASAQQVGEATNTVALANQSIGTMVNGTTIYVTNCKAISGLIIWNATGSVAIPSTNYSSTDNVINPADSELSVSIAPNITLNQTGYGNAASTIDGTCQPLGYITSSGARSIAGIIVLLLALAIAIMSLLPVMKEKLFG